MKSQIINQYTTPLVIFLQQFTINQINENLKDTIVNGLLNQQQWDIQFDEKIIKEFCLFVKFIKQTKIQVLRTVRLFYPNILMNIQPIFFSNLKMLQINGNNIQSIECISNIRIPNLIKLWIDQNNICQIRSLRKLNCPKLQLIDLMNLKINDLDSLSQLNTTALTKLYIGSIQNTQYIKIKTLNWLSKISSIKIDNLKINELISQNNGISTLRKKFIKIFIIIQ